MENFLLWITGLSGSGKTTIGKKVYAKLKRDHPNTFFLDGDAFREISGDLGYERKDRIENGIRMTRLCKQLLQQDINVVCCTMSLFEEVTSKVPEAKMYYLNAPVETLKLRKPNIYSQKNVPGEDMVYDVPKDCIVLTNETKPQIKDNVEIIWNGIMTGLQKNM